MQFILSHNHKIDKAIDFLSVFSRRFLFSYFFPFFVMVCYLKRIAPLNPRLVYLLEPGCKYYGKNTTLLSVLLVHWSADCFRTQEAFYFGKLNLFYLFFLFGWWVRSVCLNDMSNVTNKYGTPNSSSPRSPPPLSSS